MTPYPIHPDFRPLARIPVPNHRFLMPVLAGLSRLAWKTNRPAPGIRVSRTTIPGFRQEPLELTLFEAEGSPAQSPCLVYYHGGAFSLAAAPHPWALMADYARGAGCKVVFADYRLAPRNPFPAGVEDCYAALAWVFARASDLGIDPGRVAVGGDSAGGALAAAVTHMARDRGLPPLRFQLLVYPVTDRRQSSPSMKAFTDTPVWNARLTAGMWEAYCPDLGTYPAAYASPLEADSWGGLPDAYVEVAEFDCLRDEGTAYADRLREAGCQVEHRLTAGAVHGFEMAAGSPVTRRAVELRIGALSRAFGR